MEESWDIYVPTVVYFVPGVLGLLQFGLVLNMEWNCVLNHVQLILVEILYLPNTDAVHICTIMMNLQHTGTEGCAAEYNRFQNTVSLQAHPYSNFGLDSTLEHGPRK